MFVGGSFAFVVGSIVFVFVVCSVLCCVDLILLSLFVWVLLVFVYVYICFCVILCD